jgi:hypothetical protein
VVTVHGVSGGSRMVSVVVARAQPGSRPTWGAEPLGVYPGWGARRSRPVIDADGHRHSNHHLTHLTERLAAIGYALDWRFPPSSVCRLGGPG